MKDRIFYYIFFIVLGIGSGIAFCTMFKGCSSSEYIDSTQSDTIRVSDTIVIRDTVRIDKPTPYYVEVVRIDTIAQIDTVTVTIPIERKTYQNEDYRAIIEGYKPSLISMDIYRKTTLIRDTIQINNTITRYKPPRWAVSVGPGVGYGPKGIQPYIGINVGYVIWSK